MTHEITPADREAAEAVLDELLAATDPTMMTPEECEEIILQAFTTLAAEAYERGCADQHERTKAEAVKIATESAGDARYLKIAARNEGDAVGTLIRGAKEMEATVIAAAIDKMEMKDV